MRKITFPEIKDDFKLDMIETGYGCVENCVSCGFYSELCRTIEVLDRMIIHNNITQIIQETSKRIIDYCNTIITTNVNVEPLGSDAFVHLAEMVNELTGKVSSVAFISHGVRVGVKVMLERLQKIVELAKQKIIKIIVISVDTARRQGNYDKKFESYVKSFEELSAAVKYARVTFSAQGVDDKESQFYIGNAIDIRTKAMKAAGINDSDVILHERYWKPIGRAKNLNINESSDCHVIPDNEFVEQDVPMDHKWHGLLDRYGNLYVTEKLNYEACCDLEKSFYEVAA